VNAFLTRIEEMMVSKHEGEGVIYSQKGGPLGSLEIGKETIFRPLPTISRLFRNSKNVKKMAARIPLVIRNNRCSPTKATVI
jgi:hypothetical protein